MQSKQFINISAIMDTKVLLYLQRMYKYFSGSLSLSLDKLVIS